MGTTRLARAFALVARAMDERRPEALARVTAGYVRRALVEAGHVDAVDAKPPPPPLDHLHPTWLTEPLGRLGPHAGACIVALMPGDLARFAVLALEHARAEPVQDTLVPAGAGFTLRGLAASMAPPLGASPPAFLDEAGRTDPLSWVARAPIAEEIVFARWPGEAREVERMTADMLGPGSPPRMTRRLCALAACLAARPDDAWSLAGLLPRAAGSALLAARSRWALALDAADAEQIGASLDVNEGGEP